MELWQNNIFVATRKFNTELNRTDFNIGHARSDQVTFVLTANMMMMERDDLLPFK